MKDPKDMTSSEFVDYILSLPQLTDAEHEERVRILDEDSRDLDAEIDALGLPEVAPKYEFFPRLSGVDGLVNRPRDDYQAAFPILLKHLWLPHLPAIKSAILRALTVKSARGEVAHEVMRWAKEAMFPEGGAEKGYVSMKDSVMNFLRYNADESMLEDLVELASRPEYKEATDYLEGTIPRLQRHRAKRLEKEARARAREEAKAERARLKLEERERVRAEKARLKEFLQRKPGGGGEH